MMLQTQESIPAGQRFRILFETYTDEEREALRGEDGRVPQTLNIGKPLALKRAGLESDSHARMEDQKAED